MPLRQEGKIISIHDKIQSTEKIVGGIDENYDKLPFETKVNRATRKLGSAELINSYPTLTKKLAELTNYSIRELIDVHYAEPEKLDQLCDPLDPETVIAARNILEKDKLKKVA